MLAGMDYGGASEFFCTNRYHGDASALGKDRSVRCRHLLERDTTRGDLPDPPVVVAQGTKRLKSGFGFGRFVDHGSP